MGNWSTETLEQINQRVDPSKIKQVPGSGGKMFDHLEWHYVARRLNEVFGPDGWSWDGDLTITTLTQSLYAVFHGKLTIGDAVKSGIGTAVADLGRKHEIDNVAKSAESDAIKRAASKLGDSFGLSLYEKDDEIRQSYPTVESAPAPSRPSPAPASAGEKRCADCLKEGKPGVIETLPAGFFKSGRYIGREKPAADQIAECERKFGRALCINHARIAYRELNSLQEPL